MKKFKVKLECPTSAIVVVEAETEEDAQQSIFDAAYNNPSRIDWKFNTQWMTAKRPTPRKRRVGGFVGE